MSDTAPTRGILIHLQAQLIKDEYRQDGKHSRAPGRLHR